MKTQFDHQRRVVSLENLHAMCQRASGVVCHQFRVESVSRSRVHVSYSNESEYGTPNPMVAVFPCYPSHDQPAVVVDILRVINDTWDGEGWQAFHPLIDCPVLWRDPVTQEWATEDEITRKQA